MRSNAEFSVAERTPRSPHTRRTTMTILDRCAVSAEQEHHDHHPDLPAAGIPAFAATAERQATARCGYPNEACEPPRRSRLVARWSAETRPAATWLVESPHAH